MSDQTTSVAPRPPASSLPLSRAHEQSGTPLSVAGGAVAYRCNLCSVVITILDARDRVQALKLHGMWCPGNPRYNQGLSADGEALPSAASASVWTGRVENFRRAVRRHVRETGRISRNDVEQIVLEQIITEGACR